MVLATSDRELTYIYNSQTSKGKQALAYVESSELTQNNIDISKAGLTGTQWVEVVNLMGVGLADIISKEHPDVSDFTSESDLSDDHWIKIIQNNPEVLQNPILINGNRAKQITTPSQVMQFIKVDTAGLEKHPKGMDPEITPNTENEHQV